MANTERRYRDENEDSYVLPKYDMLGVLSSTLHVVEQGEYVWINSEYIKRLAKQLIQNMEQKATPVVAMSNDTYHFYDGTERTVNWILLLDALNFCFWSEKHHPRWSITYHGEVLNGYWAEAASLKRAVEEGIPLWDAEYLSSISEETVAHIFRGTQTIPLFEHRVANAREVGRVLLERYDGQFSNALQQAAGSAVQLALLLASIFPSFHDVTHYRNQEVRFFKRAQICVADLANAFAGRQWGAFTDLDCLTIFADYKLPQVLRHAHVLEYHPMLAEKVDNQQLLEPESAEEVEIRACTVWACEQLRRSLHAQGYTITSAEIDQQLWLLGQTSQDMHPYHRTRTIYY